MEAASQVTSLPSAGKKRKAKPAATSPEQAQKKGKKRRVEDANAEDIPPNEASPEQARSGSTKRSRPPRPPANGASTPAGGHKLGVTSEASSLIACFVLAVIAGTTFVTHNRGYVQAAALQLPPKRTACPSCHLPW